MAGNDNYPGQGPFRRKTVRGEAYVVQGRTLIPEAQVVSFGRARATIRSDGVSGWGAGFVQIVPLAIVEKTDAGEQRIAITDATSTFLLGLFGAAVGITLFCTTIRWFVRWLRRRKPQG